MTFGIAHYFVASVTLAALAYFAYEVVSIAFQLGTRIAIRSVLALIAPIFAGSYAFVMHRDLLHRIRRTPAVVRLSASLAAGTLAMASVSFFLVLYPFAIAEFSIGSCIAILGFTSASPPGSSRPLAPHGLAAGMLLYSAIYGVPRIVG